MRGGLQNGRCHAGHFAGARQSRGINGRRGGAGRLDGHVCATLCSSQFTCRVAVCVTGEHTKASAGEVASSKAQQYREKYTFTLSL